MADSLADMAAADLDLLSISLIPGGREGEGVVDTEGDATDEDEALEAPPPLSDAAAAALQELLSGAEGVVRRPRLRRCPLTRCSPPPRKRLGMQQPGSR